MEEAESSMRSAVGTYALLLRATDSTQVDVGALGKLEIVPGGYVYVGSAFGPGGVKARVERHARGDGARHWHVDYLRAHTDLAAAWVTYDNARRECDWAQALRQMDGASVPMEAFGASDCDCTAHLARFDRFPALDAFERCLYRDLSAHDPIHVVTAATLPLRSSTSPS